MLLFRRINFSEEQQVAFSRTLGSVYQVKGRSDAYKLSLDKNVMKEAEYFKGSFLWHFDGSVDAVPPRASFLTMRALPKTGGGDTEFANTYAAYEDLPEEKKKAYDKVRVSHSLLSDYRIKNLAPNDETFAFWQRSNPIPRIQPLVWHHKSGRKALMVGSTAWRIEGGVLDDAVLSELLDWATQPQYVYRHSWEVGDLVVYDNTGALHHALPYAADSGRVLQRSMVVGEEEFCV
jgi:alpha-ketoglutarate-dependent taurine dioxygenase